MSSKTSEPTSFASKAKREIVSWIIMIAIVVFVRSTVFGMYEIPSGSMLPTIRIGDRIFASKFAYVLWLPFAEKQLITWETPKRGDIVLFHSRTDSNTLIKRVVGVGGDELSFHNGRLVVNGQEQPEVE